MSPRRIIRPVPLVVSLVLLFAPLVPAPSSAAGTTDWPAYLLNVSHSSFARSTTTITVANAASLTKSWTWIPDPGPPGTTQQLFASPTVVGGTIYIGANTG